MEAEAAINKAFFSVANALEFEVLHGKWIPAVYWAFLVRNHLKWTKKIRESKLRNAIHQDASVETLQDQERCGKISKVQVNSRRVLSRRESQALTKTGHKNRVFVRVDTNRTLSEAHDPLHGLVERDVAAHFRQSYWKYANMTEPRRESIGWERNLADNSNAGEEEEPRVVTPPVAAIDLDCNQDIKELLTGILDPDVLKRDDLFIGEAPFEELRERVRMLGIKYQKKLHESTYNALAPNDPLSQHTELVKKYQPVFDKFCIPLNIRAIHAVIGPALKIESEGDFGIFQLNNYGGSTDKIKGKKLVAVVPSSTRQLLWKNAKRWLPDFYEAITTSDDLDRYTVCFTLIKLHKLHCEQAFHDICITLGPKRTIKMDPYRQLAMCEKANLNAEHLRIVRPFLNADRCNPFNSERQMKKKSISPTIKPTIFSVIDEDGVKQGGFYLPIKDVVEEEIQDAKDRIDEIHVIFSADHGQKAFRCHLTCCGVVHGEDNKSRVVLEKHRLVGQLDCRKDTYDLLDKSGVTAGLNEALKVAKAWQLRTPNNEAWIPIKLKCLGDLAWYSLALGKPAMSPCHCWRCQAMSSEFQKNPYFKGQKWTLEAMKERFEKLESGELKRSNKKMERGLVRQMLFDCIEPEDFIVPVLHAVILLTNSVFKHFQLWMWYRVEDVPVELVIARSEYAKAEIAKDERRKELVDLKAQLKDMTEELDQLTPRDGEFDDDEHILDHSQQSELVARLRERVNAAAEAHSQSEKDRAAAKKEMTSMEKSKEYGKTTQQVWLSVERYLREEYNIYWSVYHGGALEGNQARTLLRKAPDVMATIKKLLLEHLDGLDPEERKERADSDEIDLFIGGFERLFQYMDLIVHYCYQPSGSMSDSDVDDAKKTIRRATGLWQKLMPTIPMKVHSWQHLADDLEKYRGLKEYTDEPGERCHKTGKKDNLRLHAVRNFRQKTNSVLKTRATNAQQEVKDMMKDTEAKRPKKRKKPETESARERKKYLESILSLPVIEHDFPSMLELNKALERGHAENDGTSRPEGEEESEEESEEE